MTARKFLEQYKTTEFILLYKQKEYEALISDNINLKAFDASAVSVQSSSAGDMSMVNIVSLIEKKGRGILGEIEVCEKTMCDIEAAIKALTDPLLRNILERYYIRSFKESEIAEALGYSKRHIQRLKDKAVGMIIVPAEYANA